MGSPDVAGRHGFQNGFVVTITTHVFVSKLKLGTDMIVTSWFHLLVLIDCNF